MVGGGAAKILRGMDKAADAIKAGEKAAANVAEAARKGPGCCFVAGTLVMTETGLRPIETIEVGDKVLARDETTGETALKPVTQLIRRHDRIIWKLTLASTGDDGKATTTTFETTDDHPWRSVVGTWLQTMELKPGMEIQRARGPPAKVVSVENTGKIKPTFNLEVADFHTYFVGEQLAWVHNNNNCPIFGNAQKTSVGGSQTTHAATSQRIANEMAASGKYKSVHMNQKISTITDGKNPSLKQPDVAGVRHDGKVDAVEVRSGNQQDGALKEKYSSALGPDAGKVTSVEQDPR